MRHLITNERLGGSHLLFHFQIRTIDGKCFEVDAELDETVYDLKNRILMTQGVVGERSARLIFRQKDLAQDGDKTLRQLGCLGGEIFHFLNLLNGASGRFRLICTACVTNSLLRADNVRPGAD